jgi:uncharacterized membrane protein YfcA
MDTGQWIAILACAGAAEVVGAMAGFGAATVFTPLAMLFFDARTAIAVVAVFHLFGTASRLVFYWRGIQWKLWLFFGLTGVAGSVIGAAIAVRLTSAALEALFGGFLLLYVLADIMFPGRLKLSPAPRTLIIGGALSGMIAGLLGTGGAVRAVCLLAFGLPRAAYLGTSASLAFTVDATRLPVYIAEGLIPPSLVPLLLSLAPVAFAGAWIGQRLVTRFSASGFHRFVLAVLALMGAKLLVSGWQALGRAG